MLFFQRLFGGRPSRKLTEAMKGYVEQCFRAATVRAAGFAAAERLRALIAQGVAKDEAMRRAIAQVRSEDSVSVRIHELSLHVFLFEFATAVLDALGEEDAKARGRLLRSLSPESDDWDDVEEVAAAAEAMLFHRGWSGPLTPDEALDQWVIPFWAGQQAARDFLARFRGGAEVEPDKETANQVARAITMERDGADLPETPLLREDTLLRRRRPELWNTRLAQPGNVNATPAQIESAAVGWLEAMRGDALAQALLRRPAETATAGLDRIVPPLGVALVDFVLGAQYQVRPAFKASARPVLQGLARRLSGGEADATVERWIRLWKDLMQAYEGERPESLGDERAYALLAYGQTRGRKIGESFRDALEKGETAGWQPLSRDVELGSRLWSLAAGERWDEGDGLDWPLSDPAPRLVAAEAGARGLLEAAGLSPERLAAWDRGDAGRTAVRALLGYGTGLFRHPELIKLDLLPLLAAQSRKTVAQALRDASYSRAAAEGEIEGMALGFVAAGSDGLGLSAGDGQALARLLIDSANLPDRAGNRLMARPSHLRAEAEAGRPPLPEPPLPEPPPLAESEILGEERAGMPGRLAAALAADFGTRFAAGETFPTPDVEAVALVEALLVYDPDEAEAYCRDSGGIRAGEADNAPEASRLVGPPLQPGSWIESMVAYLQSALPPRYLAMEDVIERGFHGESLESQLDAAPGAVVLPLEGARKTCLLFAYPFAHAMEAKDDDEYRDAMLQAYLVPRGGSPTEEEFDKLVQECEEAFIVVQKVARGRYDPKPVLDELMAREDLWPAVAMMGRLEARDFERAWRAGQPLRVADDESFARATLRSRALTRERALAVIPQPVRLDRSARSR